MRLECNNELIPGLFHFERIAAPAVDDWPSQGAHDGGQKMRNFEKFQPFLRPSSLVELPLLDECDIESK